MGSKTLHLRYPHKTSHVLLFLRYKRSPDGPSYPPCSLSPRSFTSSNNLQNPGSRGTEFAYFVYKLCIMYLTIAYKGFVTFCILYASVYRINVFIYDYSMMRRSFLQSAMKFSNLSWHNSTRISFSLSVHRCLH